MAIVPPIGSQQPFFVITFSSKTSTGSAKNFQFMQTSATGAASRVTQLRNQGNSAVATGPFTSLDAARASVGLGPAAPTAPVVGVGGQPTKAAPAAKPAAKTKATTVATLKQPPFDPRLQHGSQNPLGIGSAKFDRGFMVWDTSLTATAGYSASNPPSLSFLFNPSTVQASYSLSDSTAQAAMIFGVASGGSGVPWVGLQQQMNFTIMFDRTYEVQWPPGGTAQYAGQDVVEMGCEVDVRQLKQFTGQFSASAGSAGFYTGSATAGATALGDNQKITQATGIGIGPQQGIMLMMPSYCYFGSSIAGGTSQYYGYVDSWNVQYTHYTNLMVPIRCVVDIEYTLLPQASNNLGEFNNSAVRALAAQQNQGGPGGFA